MRARQGTLRSASHRDYGGTPAQAQSNSESSLTRTVTYQLLVLGLIRSHCSRPTRTESAIVTVGPGPGPVARAQAPARDGAAAVYSESKRIFG